MSIKLILNVGDIVRNINQSSTRCGWVGTVIHVAGPRYTVEYGHKDRRQVYQKENAHRFIEKLVSEKSQCKCVHDELCEGCTRQELKDFAHFMHYNGCGLLTPSETKRRVLKKVRRNVISGKTQDEMIREMGNSRGVQQFNTRCLGTSTGQALRILGDAMCNPSTEIRIKDIDHAISDGTVRAGSGPLNEHFRKMVQSLIGDMHGFTFTDTHIVFNPIVTEETYVEIN